MGTKLQSSLLDLALAGFDPDSRADNRVKHGCGRGSPVDREVGTFDSAKYEALTKQERSTFLLISIPLLSFSLFLVLYHFPSLSFILSLFLSLCLRPRAHYVLANREKAGARERER